jgi:hypothetical protein
MKYLSAALFSLLLLACTDAEKETDRGVSAGIGNDCGPVDNREVWLRIADSNATQCPASSLDGLRIRIENDRPLDSLKTGNYADRIVRDCRDTVIACPVYSATVEITHITATEISGTYQVFDSAGVKKENSRAFTATRCIISPHCL